MLLSSSCWKTKLTQSFPCRLPLVGAPMAGVSGGLLAAETCRAGALGFLAAGYFQNVPALEAQIDIFRREVAAPAADAVDKTPPPLCIGFIGHAALSTDQGWDNYEYVLAKHKPAVVQFFAPAILHRKDGRSNVQVAHQHNAKFLAQVGSVAEAQQAIEAGVDGIIAQGSEAGGHGLRRELGSGTLPLVSKVATMTDLPVVAAGGIVNGRGVAAALALCDGAVLGTRLWASRESIGKKEAQQQLILTQSSDQVIRTTVFDRIENNLIATPWPAPYDSVGALRNEASDEWDGRPDELAAELANPDGSLLSKYQVAAKEGNTNIVKILAGEGVGEIDSIEPAYEIVMRVEQETKEVLQRMSNLIA